MLVERIWAANDYRNFHYLIADPDTGEALAVDPLDWQRCLDAARAQVSEEIKRAIRDYQVLGPEPDG